MNTWFTGLRVTSYCKIIELTSHLSYISRAFPSSTDGEDYLEHCPPEFDKSVLKNFSQRSHSTKAKLLFTRAKCFQKNTVKSWNPNIENRSKTVCIDGFPLQVVWGVRASVTNLEMAVSPRLCVQYVHLEIGWYNGQQPRHGRVGRYAVFGRASQFGTAIEGKPRTEARNTYFTLDIETRTVGME